MAEEQKAVQSALLFKKISALCDRCAVETMPHSEHHGDSMPEKAKYIVRTGAFEPWGNVILLFGRRRLAEWFKKPGTVVHAGFLRVARRSTAEKN